MTKKIRLIDDETVDVSDQVEQAIDNPGTSSLEGIDGEQLMKYAEAIDWKLWEILKILKKQAGE